MILWRLTPERFLESALSGEGAARLGGRWNSRGVPAVYLSCDPATTVLEALTTFSAANAPLARYRLLQIAFDSDSIVEIPLERLPLAWKNPADPGVARKIGDEFLREMKAALLIVPSVVLPQARNALLNPRHPEARKARVQSQQPFSFDPRWPLKR